MTVNKAVKKRPKQKLPDALQANVDKLKRGEPLSKATRKTYRESQKKAA